VASVDEEGISTIAVFPEFAEGLFGIETFKELDLLFVFDRSVGYDLLVHPQGDPDKPLRGVFASRSPRRPNPIGLTRVRLIEHRGNLLKVQGLDAFPDTPILDIKQAPGNKCDARRRCRP
jgi:tRNA-Thr(GGU) m(6)t(6)A37 methyltransferase TsaA